MLTIFRSLQLCNITIALAIICSVKAQHSRQISPRDPQENENILNTKDDIGRLEGCHYVLTDGTDLIDPRNPDTEQKECDGKKVVDIINIVSSKMNSKNREKLFKIAIEGIKKGESYLDVATYIDSRMGDPKKELWIVFVGTKRSFSGKSKASVPEMLTFVIGEIMIEAFRVDGSPAGSSGSSGETDPQVRQPFTGSPSLESSNFETEINQFVVKSLTRVKDNEKSADKICSSLINQLGNNFRAKISPNAWSCAAGPHDKFSLKIADQSVTRLSISWGSSVIQIMRQIEQAKSYSLDSDVIRETRQKLDLVSVNNTDLTPKQEKIMISIIKDGIKNSESYAGIARYIQKVAGSTFAQRFHVSVGLDTQYWIFFWKTDPWLINLKINELRVLAYALC
ncbi:uncharacterized protein LOC141851967 [Brevipalpus obovatus]|uniref:uncharacterized protein LOC141851967 n=1 Tax=Brevipalpus obovatus TaxID=246614 RepID=UPI003D9EEF42